MPIRRSMRLWFAAAASGMLMQCGILHEMGESLNKAGVAAFAATPDCLRIIPRNHPPLEGEVRVQGRGPAVVVGTEIPGGLVGVVVANLRADDQVLPDVVERERLDR